MGSQSSSAYGGDRTVRSHIYPLDGNFNKIYASGHIQFELTQVNNQPSVTIETEQWVHDSGLIVSTRSNDGLHVQLRKHTNYPPIKVYVNYRTPLIGLKTTGASSMRSTNFIRSDPSSPLNLGHYGSSTAALELQHGSHLIADIAGSSRVTLSGQVQGNARLSVDGSAKLSAIRCPIMRMVEAEVQGSAQASVYSVEGVHARANGAGMLYYQGILLSQHRNGASSIMPYSGRNREEF